MVSRGPVREILWGCLKRFGHFLAQRLSLSEQIWRMSQAIRWFQHSKGGGGGYLTRPRSRIFLGMSQAVLLFSPPTCFAFGADLEDVRSQFVGMSQAVWPL